MVDYENFWHAIFSVTLVREYYERDDQLVNSIVALVTIVMTVMVDYENFGYLIFSGILVREYFERNDQLSNNVVAL